MVVVGGLLWWFWAASVWLQLWVLGVVWILDVLTAFKSVEICMTRFESLLVPNLLRFAGV
jgi:hypothetical protein